MQISFKSILIISLLFILIACSSAASQSTAAESIASPEKKAQQASVKQSSNSVSIKKYKFIPATLTIKLGETVTWTNNEKRQYHSVWFEQSGDKESDYLFPDDQYSKAFSSKGTFTYKCGPHPEMIGVIIVE